MKPQSIQGALPTESLLLSLEDCTIQEAAKLRWSNCITIILQLTASLAACGLVHWAVT